MIQIMIKEAREFLREKSNLFFFLMFPVVLIFLLGNLLSSMDRAEEAIGEVRIQYLTETDDIADIMAIEGFIGSIEDDQNIIFEKTGDIKAARELASRDEITAAIVFTGKPLEIQIYEGTNRIKNRTVGAIMNGFAQAGRAVSVISREAVGNLAGSMGTIGEFIRKKDLGIERTMLDYYAVTMMAMVSFMSIILGSMAFAGENQNRTINRLLIAPMHKMKLFFSKILGLFPQVILQITIIMVISTLVFHAHYAVTFLDNLRLFLMFFAVTLTMISIGAVYGLLVNINPMAVLMPVIWIMMFLSGTYSKEIYIKGVTEAMPIYQIQEAAFDLAIFGRGQKADTVILVCLLITAIMLSIGAYIFGRKEEVR